MIYATFSTHFRWYYHNNVCWNPSCFHTVWWLTLVKGHIIPKRDHNRQIRFKIGPVKLFCCHNCRLLMLIMTMRIIKRGTGSRKRHCTEKMNTTIDVDFCFHYMFVHVCSWGSLKMSLALKIKSFFQCKRGVSWELELDRGLFFFRGWMGRGGDVLLDLSEFGYRYVYMAKQNWYLLFVNALPRFLWFLLCKSNLGMILICCHMSLLASLRSYAN